ncbi:MAG TPA: PEP-utilizing enzyme [archaeon]|nr:PEP-utilizing enzyme [archaeon]
MTNDKIPDYVSWLKEPDVNRAFLDLALKNYPLSEVRSALPIGLKGLARQIKDTRPDGANYLWEKAEALERGEEVKVFGKKIQTRQIIRKNNSPLRSLGYKADAYLLERVKDLMEKEDRKDPEFRFILTDSQIGSLAKYLTHDPELNPNARPHGSPGDESLAFGQAFVQLVGLAQSRGIDIEKAIYEGLNNWEEGDWRKSEAKGGGSNVIKGLLACGGEVTCNAFLDPYRERLDDMDGEILVTKFAKPETAAYFSKISGIVTDDGGKTCHAATMAREYNLPCIVGTGNATERIAHGRKIRMEPGEKPGEGLVYLL